MHDEPLDFPWDDQSVQKKKAGSFSCFTPQHEAFQGGYSASAPKSGMARKPGATSAQVTRPISLEFWPSQGTPSAAFGTVRTTSGPETLGDSG